MLLNSSKIVVLVVELIAEKLLDKKKRVLQKQRAPNLNIHFCVGLSRNQSFGIISNNGVKM